MKHHRVPAVATNRLSRWLWLKGTPRAKGRPRVGGLSRAGRRIIYTPAATVLAEHAIRVQWREAQLPLEEDADVAVAIVAIGGGADVDNIAKLTLDALQGAAFRNDRQVKSLKVEKIPTAKHLPAGVMVQVSPISSGWAGKIRENILVRLGLSA